MGETVAAVFAVVLNEVAAAVCLKGAAAVAVLAVVDAVTDEELGS